MIFIDNISTGRFGNKLFHYNNLRQLANILNTNYYCVDFENSNIFKDFSTPKSYGKIILKLNSETINSYGIDYIVEKSNIYHYQLDPCMGELFFKLHSIDTKDVFKFKDRVKLSKDYCNSRAQVPFYNVAIHFRGNDFPGWFPGYNEYVDTDYYINSIDYVSENIKENKKYYLFTDDITDNSYKEIINYLEKNKINFELGSSNGNGNNYVDDFKKMSECDLIISSPSTFCITAGFITKDKKIIHSKKWIDNRVEAEDTFWFDLVENNNSNYKIWKTV